MILFIYVCLANGLCVLIKVKLNSIQFMNLDCVFDSFEFNDELLLIEMDRMEKTPMSIKEKMKKSGLIKREKENVDNYINKGVDAVVLDVELFKNSLSSFSPNFKYNLSKGASSSSPMIEAKLLTLFTLEQAAKS